MDRGGAYSSEKRQAFKNQDEQCRFRTAVDNNHQGLNKRLRNEELAALSTNRNEIEKKPAKA